MSDNLTLKLLIGDYVNRDIRSLIHKKLNKCDLYIIYRALFPSNKKIVSLEMANVTANNGYLNLMKWLDANGCPRDEETCAYAAASGNLELLVWTAKKYPSLLEIIIEHVRKLIKEKHQIKIQ